MLETRKVGALLAAGLIVVSAAGCSSDSSKSSDSSGGKPQSASSSGPSLTGEPIKVGMIAPTNAPVYSVPGELAAVRAAVATINSQGGIKGRPLVLDYCNEANDANKGAACGRKVAASDDVATLNVISPFAGPAVTEALKGVANVGYLALTPPEYEAMNNFPTNGGGAFFQPASVVGALQDDSSLKKVVIAANEGQQSDPIVSSIEKAVNNAGGTVSGKVRLPLTTIADYTPYAQKLISSGAQVAALSMSGTASSGIIKAVHQLGGNMVFTSSAGAMTSPVLKDLGSLANGIYIGSPTPWINDASNYPGMNDFVASVKAEEERGDKDAAISNLGPFAVLDWLTTMQLRDVLTGIVDKGQDITRESILAAMSSAKDLKTYNVVKTPWSPSVRQTALPGFQNVSITDVYLLKVSDGQMSLATEEPIDMTQYVK